MIKNVEARYKSKQCHFRTSIDPKFTRHANLHFVNLEEGPSLYAFETFSTGANQPTKVEFPPRIQNSKTGKYNFTK